ncbi:hypothetical protein ACMFMF_010567 [Clarireedia jacksonii]
MRAQVFFGLDAARLVAVAAGTACSSMLMKHGPWPPMLLALLVTYIGSSLPLFIPNSKPSHYTTSHSKPRGNFSIDAIRQSLSSFMNLGESAGGPLYAGLFSVALSFKKQWLGLLFWVAAGLAALLTIMFCNRQILDATVEDEE